MAAVVSIVNGCSVSIDVHCGNHPHRSRLVLYKP